MIKHLSKAFENLCDILAILNLLFMAGIGAILGIVIGLKYFTPAFAIPVFGIGGLLIGLLIAYIQDILIFGFFAQIIEIRKKLESK